MSVSARKPAPFSASVTQDINYHSESKAHTGMVSLDASEMDRNHSVNQSFKSGTDSRVVSEETDSEQGK